VQFRKASETWQTQRACAIKQRRMIFEAGFDLARYETLNCYAVES